TRWRISDQFKRRERSIAVRPGTEESEGRGTATIDRINDPSRPAFDSIWDAEWAGHITEIALRKVRDKVSPKHYQIYDCYVLKEWDVARVAEHIGVSTTQIYVAKHRVGAHMRKAISELEKTDP
ncbi:MAG: sigma-70 family RNA polymerase sigma factor, partial [Verrucomicrobiales bacterium]